MNPGGTGYLAGGKEWIESTDFAVVRQDMNFSRQTSGEERLFPLWWIKTLKPELPVVLITALGSIELAVQGIRAGASDFITKPWTHQQIVPAFRANLFTPFFSTKENGQGIGLTMVQEILEQHGFEFSLESRPGAGTEFRIAF